MDSFAGSEVEGEAGTGAVGRDMGGLVAERFEVDFDARVGGVPEGAVEEAVGAEVGAELAIEVGEDIAVEGGGDTLGVVVGGEQGGNGFVRGRERGRCPAGGRRRV